MQEIKVIIGTLKDQHFQLVVVVVVGVLVQADHQKEVQDLKEVVRYLVTVLYLKIG